jgi:hypothetical protein
MKEKKLSLENKFQFIEDEITIRVESVKVQVELVGEELKVKLSEMRKDAFK